MPMSKGWSVKQAAEMVLDADADQPCCDDHIQGQHSLMMRQLLVIALR